MESFRLRRKHECELCSCGFRRVRPQWKAETKCGASFVIGAMTVRLVGRASQRQFDEANAFNLVVLGLFEPMMKSEGESVNVGSEHNGLDLLALTGGRLAQQYLEVLATEALATVLGKHAHDDRQHAVLWSSNGRVSNEDAVNVSDGEGVSNGAFRDIFRAELHRSDDAIVYCAPLFKKTTVGGNNRQ